MIRKMRLIGASRFCIPMQDAAAVRSDAKSGFAGLTNRKRDGETVSAIDRVVRRATLS